MKIAFAVQPWDRVESRVGQGTSIAIIAYNLAMRLAGEYDVSIYANRGPRQPADEVDEHGVRIRRISVPRKRLFQLADRLTGFWGMSPPLFATPWYYRAYARRVAMLAREQRVDIIHINTFFQHASIVRALNPNARIVLHLHDEMMFLLPRELVASHLEDIDCILGVSDFVTGRIKARFPAIADRCRTLYNGVDPNRFSHRPVTTSGDPGRHILYVGRVSPEKGIHVLLEAFRGVADIYPDCRLDVIGSPGLLPYAYHLGLTQDPHSLTLKRFYGDGFFGKLRRQVLQKNTSYLAELRRIIGPNMEDRVRFCGAVANKDLPQFYSQTYMVVFPSVWSEPFGMPITESMACAVPVVATRSGGIPELIEDGQTGLLVERNDPHSLREAMLQLLENPVWRDALGRAARQRVLRSLTFDHAAKTLADCYRNLLTK